MGLLAPEKPKYAVITTKAPVVSTLLTASFVGYSKSVYPNIRGVTNIALPLLQQLYFLRILLLSSDPYLSIQHFN
jgi:hypothetical protein